MPTLAGGQALLEFFLSNQEFGREGQPHLDSGHRVVGALLVLLIEVVLKLPSSPLSLAISVDFGETTSAP